MRRYINLDTLEWQEAPNLAVPMKSIKGKYLSKFRLEVFFVRGPNGVAELLPSGTTLTLGIKPQGVFDGAYIAEETTWTIPGSTAAPYVCEVFLDSGEIASRLVDDSDGTNDLPSMAALVEVEWITGEGEDPEKSFSAPLTIENSIIRDSLPGGGGGSPAARFYGVATSNTINEALVLGLAGTDNVSGVVISTTLNPVNQFLILAIPATGTITSIIANGLQSISDFEAAQTVTVSGNSKKVYRSTYRLTGSYVIATS